MFDHSNRNSDDELLSDTDLISHEWIRSYARLCGP